MQGPVLIIGGSSGIGAACARRLSAGGRTVILVARDKEKLRALAETLPSEALCLPYDLNNLEGIKSIFTFCSQNSQRLDGMIYCAGKDSVCPVKASQPALMEEIMRINCVAFLEAAKHFYSKRYSNNYSKIVAISSSASQSCDRGMGMYSASKAALNALVKTMAKEFTRRGILVNAILPAGVMTPMAAEKMQITSEIGPINVDLEIQRLNENPIPLNSEGDQPYGIISPDSVADLAEFLISEQNKYITGALLPISAGRAF